MSSLWSSRDATGNIVLFVGEGRSEIKAHQFILTASSPFFQSMLSNHDWKEERTKTIELPTLTPYATAVAIQWMYTGELVLTQNDYPSESTTITHTSERYLRIEAAMDYFLIPIQQLECYNPLLSDLRTKIWRMITYPEGDDIVPTMIQLWQCVQAYNNSLYSDMMAKFIASSWAENDRFDDFIKATLDVENLCILVRKAAVKRPCVV
ncbi:hypothetical protein HDV00_012090 [Rhizophlyctis rosea]|nr:hypothetical protein HDV00_012090 [Rhizophlyctis rosea]